MRSAGSPTSPVQPKILPKTFIPALFPKRARGLLKPVKNADSGAPVLETLLPEIWSHSSDCYQFEKPYSKGHLSLRHNKCRSSGRRESILKAGPCPGGLGGLDFQSLSCVWLSKSLVLSQLRFFI